MVFLVGNLNIMYSLLYLQVLHPWVQPTVGQNIWNINLRKLLLAGHYLHNIDIVIDIISNLEMS